MSTPLGSLLTRRTAVKLAVRAAAAGVLAPHLARSASPPPAEAGAVVGNATAARVGLQVLKDGGNAVDAAITAAFAAAICAPSSCGIGGYGGHAVVALAGGRKVTTIDFNSTAPAQARATMYPLDGDGRVVGNVNTHGWLAAGVPGTLAGLELTLQRYGTRPLRAALAPAIALCEGGRYAAAVKGIDDASPPKSATGAPPVADQPRAAQRNAALARLLRTLAERNSTDSFYRGDLAATVADAFQRNGGLVTRADLAAFRAREVAPLTFAWNDVVLHTAPLTATGLLVFQALGCLQQLNFPRLSAEERLHAKVEALRLAWADRLATWGDPEQVNVPVERLLSRSYAASSSEKISAALAAQMPIPLQVESSHAGGTINLSVADRHGNLVAITLTHGGGYGARVYVPELGLILGHGMSRFDPRPGRPNSPGPGKRPINNMCPTIVTRAGVPVLAAGGAGGTRIPNSLFEVLLNYVALGTSLETAHAAPRLHVDGTLQLGLEKKHSPADEKLLRSLGFTTTRGASANISAVSFDPATGATRGVTNAAV